MNQDKLQVVADVLAMKEFLSNHGWKQNPANADQYSMACDDCVYFVDLYVIDKEVK